MTKASTRTRTNRRDRRLAKASDWRRESTKNARKVGHHASVSHAKGRTWRRKSAEELPSEKRAEPLRVPLAELSRALKDD